MRTVLITTAIGLWIAQSALAAGGGAAGCCEGPACCEQPACGACGACDRCCKVCDDRCPKCGCEMVCKVVCEKKKIVKHVWQVECEQFCPALPGCADCCCGGAGCDKCCCADRQCGSCKSCCEDVCAAERARCIVPPQCGKVRARKKLVKKEVVCEIPAYKCVPVCCNCACPNAKCGEDAAPKGEAPAPAPASTPAPAAPAPPAPEKTTDIAPLPPVAGGPRLR